jgi:hypothetical protein
MYKILIFILLFITIIILFNNKLSKFFQVNGESISKFDVNTLYMSLGLIRPNKLKMNTTNIENNFTDMTLKENIIVASVGASSMSILALLLIKLII